MNAVIKKRLYINTLPLNIFTTSTYPYESKKYNIKNFMPGVASIKLLFYF